MSEVDTKTQLDRDGYLLLKGAISAQELKEIETSVEAAAKHDDQQSAGLRSLLRNSEWIRAFAARAGQRIIGNELSVPPHAVRAILFAKSADANWYVRWHQDRTIPVEERADIEGFTAWSNKDGVVHCYPPADVLEQMVAMRIHIDAADAENGAIRFVVGTHRFGILNDYEKERWKQEGEKVTVAAEPGDVILMRPLILHTSSKATNDKQRRVLHIEYATTELPPPLRWGQA